MTAEGALGESLPDGSDMSEHMIRFHERRRLNQLGKSRRVGGRRKYDPPFPSPRQRPAGVVGKDAEP
jgi:hypothetical protein